MKRLPAFLLLTLGLCAHAGNFSDVTTQVNFGDKISSFRIFEKAGKPYYSFMDTYGKASEGPLSRNNYAFLVKKTNEVLKLESNDTSFCLRKFISVKTVVHGKPVERIGCIGSSSATAKKVTELANTLQLLL